MGCVYDYDSFSSGDLRVVETCRSFFLGFRLGAFFTGTLY
jgi:hypothetical protein